MKRHAIRGERVVMFGAAMGPMLSSGKTTYALRFRSTKSAAWLLETNCESVARWRKLLLKSDFR